MSLSGTEQVDDTGLRGAPQLPYKSARDAYSGLGISQACLIRPCSRRNASAAGDDRLERLRIRAPSAMAYTGIHPCALAPPSTKDGWSDDNVVVTGHCGRAVHGKAHGEDTECERCCLYPCVVRFAGSSKLLT